MIDSIALIRYQNTAHCSSMDMSCKESFLETTYTFMKGNVYGLISDFGCGSWALATCLGGCGDDCETGEIRINGQAAVTHQLQQYSAFIPEESFTEKPFVDSRRTVRECIQNALTKSRMNLSVNEIKDMFHLSDARFDRTLDCISGEIWLASLAIQFSSGKDIFCFPWMNAVSISRIVGLYRMGILYALKKNGKIVLIPTNQKRAVRHCCDALLLMDSPLIKRQLFGRRRMSI